MGSSFARLDEHPEKMMCSQKKDNKEALVV